MVNNRHRAFARAVVALARQHGMNNLNMTFRESSSAMELPADRSWEEVRAQWSEGRHGIKSNIELFTQARDTIGEGEVP